MKNKLRCLTVLVLVSAACSTPSFTRDDLCDAYPELCEDETPPGTSPIEREDTIPSSARGVTNVPLAEQMIMIKSLEEFETAYYEGFEEYPLEDYEYDYSGYPLGQLDPTTIDFSSQMLLVILSGPQGEGGHAVEITAIAEEDDRLVISLTHSIPGEGCRPYSSAFYDNAYDIVLTTISDKTPELAATEAEYHCEEDSYCQNGGGRGENGCANGLFCDNQNYCHGVPGAESGQPTPDVCYGQCL